MRAEYKRDMNHNYLVLHGDKTVDTSSYQVRMLVGNIIPSLLKCRFQGMDGKVLFYYEITSRQPLTALYEKKKFRVEDLQLIFGGFVRVMEEMSEYLLNPEQLVLRPEYLYLDIEKGELFFCYLPGFEQGVREQLQTLTEYVLPKLDHEDGCAVMLGYGIYRKALEDTFHLEFLKEELYQVPENGKEQKEIKGSLFLEQNQAKEYGAPEIEENHEEEKPRKIEISDLLWENEKSQKREDSTEKDQKNDKKKSCIRKTRNRILGCMAAVMVIGAILGAACLGYLPWIPAALAAGMMLVLFGAGGLVSSLTEKRRKQKEAEDWNRIKVKKQIRIPEEEQENSFPERDPVPEYTKGQPVQKENPLQKDKLTQKEKPTDYGETVVLSQASVQGPASLVSREPGELATIYLTEELTVIGKLEGASDAVIPLPTVSRVHARIRKREGAYFLTDLNSRNGTSVNGRMLKAEEEYQLQDEDEVDFAQARYIFLY